MQEHTSTQNETQPHMHRQKQYKKQKQDKRTCVSLCADPSILCAQTHLHTKRERDTRIGISMSQIINTTLSSLTYICNLIEFNLGCRRHRCRCCFSVWTINVNLSSWQSNDLWVGASFVCVYICRECKESFTSGVGGLNGFMANMSYTKITHTVQENHECSGK